MFLRHPRQVLTRSAIFEHVWGYDFGATSNSLGVYMGYLRRKTEAGERAAPAAHRPRRRLRPAAIGASRRGQMSFRRRITLVSAAAVAIAVVLASLLTYLLTSHQLHSQVDAQLRDRGRESTRLLRFLDEGGIDIHHTGARAVRAGLGSDATGRTGSAQGARQPSRSSNGTGGTSAGANNNPFGNLPPEPDQVRGYQQVVGAQGTIIVRSARGISLPVNAATRRLAADGGASFFTDASVDGTHLRILAEPLGAGRAVQYAQPLTEVDSLLRRLRLILALLDIGGIALAALLGRLVAGAAVLPLKRLTQATEHVALTQDLSGRIELTGEDEIGRLAIELQRDARRARALDERARRVRPRAAPARGRRLARAAHARHEPAHEHRDPPAGTGHGARRTPAPARRRGRADRRADAADERPDRTRPRRGAQHGHRGHPLRRAVGDVAERTRRNSPETPLLLELAPTLLAGVPARLERAVANLLDNAVKYSPPGEPVEIELCTAGS